MDRALHFDAVVRNPPTPTGPEPAYDSGDHLHQNDAGFTAPADSVDMSPL